MADSPNNLVITTLAKGATAQLRELVEYADKDAALPIYRELKRLAAQLARKHNFGTEVRPEHKLLLEN